MKKVLTLILTFALTATFAFASYATDSKTLKFNDDGKFTIVHLTDIQDNYPMSKTTKQFIVEMLQTVQPDIVVLGGDNCVAENHEDIPAGIKEICDIFVENQTYFTLVFGNHDAEHGYTQDELFPFYQEFGGEYCLAYDADPSLHGTGTHVLPVYSSDGSKVAYNLFMFDSGDYVWDENGETIGYDSVHEDQIEWYKSVSDAAKEANGGELVPAIVFQHIIVEEAMDKLYAKSVVNLGSAGYNFADGSYTKIPIVGSIKSGWMLEHPAAGYYNHGEFDAIVEQGDVKAIFSGHDHKNNFTITIDGVDLVNSGGCTYYAYGDDSTRGCRVITLDENDTSTYETYTYNIAEAALKEGSQICSAGDDLTLTEAKLTVAKVKFMTVFTKFLSTIFWFTDTTTYC